MRARLPSRRKSLKQAPVEELEELALIYQAKGIPADRARELANSIISNPRTALDTLTREELGIDSEGLGGSAWVAAGTSFALFAAGALVPLLPYVFTGGRLAVGLNGALAAFGLFASGALGSFFTGNRSCARVRARPPLAWPPRASHSCSARWSEPDLDSEHCRSVTQRNVTSNSTAPD
jgi:VIT1/CCC1 family predicted Fe2+/Mn2+ transporter